MTSELCIDRRRHVSPLAVNEFPPGDFIARAIATLPAAGPDLPPQTVEIDARPGWGLYRVAFIFRRKGRGSATGSK